MLSFHRLVLLLSIAAVLAAGPKPALDESAMRSLHAKGPAVALFFIAADCPISNSYAPEIQRICSAYASKGVSCALVYSDAQITDAAMQKHAVEFGYKNIPAIHDASHKLAEETGATITPEVAVIATHGSVLYRGRIDNLYVKLGSPRLQVTEHYLSDALDEILSGSPVTKSRTAAVGCYIPK